MDFVENLFNIMYPDSPSVEFIGTRNRFIKRLGTVLGKEQRTSAETAELFTVLINCLRLSDGYSTPKSTAELVQSSTTPLFITGSRDGKCIYLGNDVDGQVHCKQMKTTRINEYVKIVKDIILSYLRTIKTNNEPAWVEFETNSIPIFATMVKGMMYFYGQKFLGPIVSEFLDFFNEINILFEWDIIKITCNAETKRKFPCGRFIGVSECPLSHKKYIFIDQITQDDEAMENQVGAISRQPACGGRRRKTRRSRQSRRSTLKRR
jgi:hypothetical protein